MVRVRLRAAGDGEGGVVADAAWDSGGGARAAAAAAAGKEDAGGGRCGGGLGVGMLGCVGSMRVIPPDGGDGER